MAKKVAVVGSGIAGLTAAYELDKAGHDVVVLESKDITGGRMSAVPRGDFESSTGAETIFAFYTDMHEIIDEVGLRDRVLELPGIEGGVIHRADGGSHTYDAGTSIEQLFTTDALSLRSKLRLPRLVAEIHEAGKEIDANFAHTAARFDDESMAAYLTRTVGADLVDNFADPLFEMNWTWAADEISKAYFLSWAKHLGEGLGVATFLGGIHELTRELAGRLTVRTRTTVTELVPRAGAGRLVRFRNADGTLGEEEFDGVVVAVQGDRVAGIVPDLLPDERAFLQKVRYTRSVKVLYELSGPVPPRQDMYARTHPSPLSVIATVPEEILTGRAKAMVLIEANSRGMREYLERGGGPGGVDDFYRPVLRAEFDDFDSLVVGVHETWWDDMLPYFHVGYHRAVADFLTLQQHRPRTDLVFCGDYISHAHTGGACASGRKAGRDMIRRLERRNTVPYEPAPDAP
ncbi:FAD-dependent oxidoreductase [Actinomycetes bacterium KLBMP 9759]